METEQLAQADGHIGVAGEVEIDLEGEGQHAQPGARHRQLAQRHGLIALPQHPHIVGDEHLFRHAHHKGLHAGGEFVRGAGPLVDLIPQVLIFDDGSGDQLGEQGDEGAEVDDGPLSPGVAPVDVDGVAHGLEGVEGDADGEGQAQGGHEADTHRPERAGDKVPVLKEEEQRQIEKDR